MYSLDYIKNKHPEITKKITEEQVRMSMGKTFNEIVNIYYSYLPEDKAVQYAKEAFDKNIENLLENGGTLYTNTKSTIIELAKKYKLFIVINCIEGYIESFLNTSGLKDYFIDYESNGKTKLSKGENILRNNKIMPEFDGDVFEAIVKKVIVGEKDDPMAVCFILKNGNEYKDSTEERHEKIKEDIHYDNQDIVLDFFSHQNVVNFESNGIGKTKKLLNKIKVKVVFLQNNVL